MDEARRFFRYVTPGITFFTELLLFVWIILPNFVETKIRSLNTEAGLGFAVGLILVSGGFGFLLGTVHHFLHWHFPYRAIDHVNFVNLLINPKTTDNTIGIDETVMRNINAVNEHKISTVPDREHAWIIVTALWNSRTEKSSYVKGAKVRVESLFDLAHSLGTGRVATLFAFFAAMIIVSHNSTWSLECGDIVRFVVVLVLAFAFLCLHHHGYTKVGYYAQKITEQVLFDALIREQSQKTNETKKNNDNVQETIISPAANPQ